MPLDLHATRPLYNGILAALLLIENMTYTELGNGFRDEHRSFPCGNGCLASSKFRFSCF